MKRIVGVTLLILLLAGCGKSAQLETPEPPKGFDVGNGGDVYAIQFVALAHEVADQLDDDPLDGITAAELRQAITTTKVISVETLTLNGKPIDAINYRHASPPRIEVNRAAWDRLRYERHDRMVLAFHEYLGILGKDDSLYQLSKLLDRASVCSRSRAVITAIENLIRRSCDRITKDDLRFVEVLDLDRQGITELKVGDFSFMPRLHSLSLKDNQLARLPTGLFADLPSLRTLILSDNRIEAIEPRAFQGLRALSALHLQRNQIRAIGAEAFDGMSVERLGLSPSWYGTFVDLDQNPIETIAPRAFLGLSVKHLFLDSKPPRYGAELFEKTYDLETLSLNLNFADELVSPRLFEGAKASELNLEIQNGDRMEPGFLGTLPSVSKLMLQIWKRSVPLERLGDLEKIPALQELTLSYYMDAKEPGLADTQAKLPSFTCVGRYPSSGAQCTRKP